MQFSLGHVARDLASQRTRTLLTGLGIAWGTFSVCLMLAFGTGLRSELKRTLAGLGENIVIGWPSQTSRAHEGMGKGRRIQLDEPDLETMRRNVRGLGGISSEYRRNFPAGVGGTSTTADTHGVHPEYGTMRTLVPQPGGRFLDPLDMAERRRVVFLGNKLAEELFGRGGDPVGREMLLAGSTFRVVGVMTPKKQDAAYAGMDEIMAFIPATTMRMLTGNFHMDNFVLQARDASATQTLMREARAVLARRQRFDPADTQAVQFWDTTEQAKFNDTMGVAITAFLGVVGCLILIVAGIGVSNIMGVVVEERTREIGITMALGARPRSVQGRFLMEALLLTLAGGTAGFLAAWGMCALLAATVGRVEYLGTPVVSAAVAATTAGLLGTVGLAAGHFPARAASRLDPVVAMRSVL